MSKLFEIHDAIERVLAEEVDYETGEITDETLAKLDALEIARDEKALAVARYLIGEASEGERVKAQADRLATRAKAHANRAERLKGYLQANLPIGHKIRDDVVQIGWRKSSAVHIHHEDELPEEFWRVRREPDKQRAKDALKEGREVPGAELVVRHHLSIR